MKQSDRMFFLRAPESPRKGEKAMAYAHRLAHAKYHRALHMVALRLSCEGFCYRFELDRESGTTFFFQNCTDALLATVEPPLFDD